VHRAVYCAIAMLSCLTNCGRVSGPFSPFSLVRSVVLYSVHDMGCNSVISRNIYSTCKLFGLSSGDFLNNRVMVGDERLFTVTVTEKERMYVELVRELMCLRDGYLSLSNGFVMPREDLQTILNCVTVDTVYFVFLFLFLYFFLVLRVRFL